MLNVKVDHPDKIGEIDGGGYVRKDSGIFFPLCKVFFSKVGIILD